MLTVASRTLCRCCCTVDSRHLRVQRLLQQLLLQLVLWVQQRLALSSHRRSAAHPADPLAGPCHAKCLLPPGSHRVSVCKLLSSMLLQSDCHVGKDLPGSLACCFAIILLLTLLLSSGQHLHADHSDHVNVAMVQHAITARHEFPYIFAGSFKLKASITQVFWTCPDNSLPSSQSAVDCMMRTAFEAL